MQDNIYFITEREDKFYLWLNGKVIKSAAKESTLTNYVESVGGELEQE